MVWPEEEEPLSCRRRNGKYAMADGAVVVFKRVLDFGVKALAAAGDGLRLLCQSSQMAAEVAADVDELAACKRQQCHEHRRH